ncbi:MAG: SDR family NAD(P)-dependent oxidoreductase [Solirubrobacterales bacterium]
MPTTDARPRRVQGKVAIVTGAARGMGAAHARALVDHGARVVVADLREDEGRALAAELGDAARFAGLDVTDEAGWAATVQAALDAFGRLDVLVNNAGILDVRRLEDTSLADYRRVVEVNQIGPYLGMRAVVAPMRRAGGGSIVNVSSTAGMVGYTDFFAYTAAKWAVRGMTKAAAAELARRDPGQQRPPRRHRDLMIGGIDVPTDAIALGRLGRPEEVAMLVVYLASDESSYTTAPSTSSMADTRRSGAAGPRRSPDRRAPHGGAQPRIRRRCRTAASATPAISAPPLT